MDLQPVTAEELIYKIELFAVDEVDILDGQGTVFQPISPEVDLILRGVSYEPGTEVEDAEEERRSDPDRAVFWAPHTISFDVRAADHEIRFRTTASNVMQFEIQRGTGLDRDQADLLMVYADMKELGIPPGVRARFRFTEAAVSDLELDTDGSGNYTTKIPPQFKVTGNDAKDEIPPRVSIHADISGAIATITIKATDNGSGVQDVTYQIGDGNPNYSPYTGPFKVDISKDVIVFAVADDRAGNRGLAMKAFEAGLEKAIEGPYRLRDRGSSNADRQFEDSGSPGNESVE